MTGAALDDRPRIYGYVLGLGGRAVHRIPYAATATTADPVEPYIRPQGRFRHLDDEAIRSIQAEVDVAWEYLQRMVGSSA